MGASSGSARRSRQIRVAPGWRFPASIALGFLTIALNLAAIGWVEYDGRPEVTVDNATSQPFEVLIDGRAEAVVPPGETARILLWLGGERRLVVRPTTMRGGATSIFDSNVSIATGGKYLLDPGASRRYEVRTFHYDGLGGWGSLGPRTERVIAGRAFVDASDLDGVLEPAPRTIRVRTMRGSFATGTWAGLFQAGD